MVLKIKDRLHPKSNTQILRLISSKKLKDKGVWFPLADPRNAKERLPPQSNFFAFMQFLAKLMPTNRLAHATVIYPRGTKTP